MHICCYYEPNWRPWFESQNTCFNPKECFLEMLMDSKLEISIQERRMISISCDPHKCRHHHGLEPLVPILLTQSKRGDKEIDADNSLVSWEVQRRCANPPSMHTMMSNLHHGVRSIADVTETMETSSSLIHNQLDLVSLPKPYQCSDPVLSRTKCNFLSRYHWSGLPLTLMVNS